MFFENTAVKEDILRKRAYNLRWATVPEGVIPLTAADPDFPSAPKINEAICRFTKDRYLCYGPPEGLPQFKESLARFFFEKRNIDVSPSLILPIDSAAFGIYLTCKTFLQNGDEAIIFDPVDFLFRYSIEAIGGIAIPFSIPAGTSEVDFEELESLITNKTQMICLCNPLNPTGKVFTKAELLQFGVLAEKYDLIILSDEIWSDIVFTPHVFTSIASLDEDISARTITIIGFSKSYGLAGLRIGAIQTTNKEFFEKLFTASLHQSTIHGANVLSQVAATAALDECQDWLEAFIIHLQKIRDFINEQVNIIPGFSSIPPEGCYVSFVNIKNTGKTSAEIKEILLQKGKVLVVPGLPEWFGDGAAGYIRLSFASSEKIVKEALERIKYAMINVI